MSIIYPPNFHKKGLLLIRPPRTAGGTIREFLWNSTQLERIGTEIQDDQAPNRLYSRGSLLLPNHYGQLGGANSSERISENMIDSIYKIYNIAVSIRNPWDRFISSLAYFAHGADRLGNLAKKEHFEEFLSDEKLDMNGVKHIVSYLRCELPSMKDSMRSLAGLNETLREGEDVESMYQVSEANVPKMIKLFKSIRHLYIHVITSQSSFIEGIDDEKIFFIRYENMKDDISSLCSQLNLSYDISKLSHKNNLGYSKYRKRYQDYYTEESKMFVADMFKDDIERFNFKFSE